MSKSTWILGVLLASCSAPSHGPILLPSRALENVHELAPGVISGAGPQGDSAFGELARLGVKTVISVDGARPDIEAARRHGLRYVHLPIGYDGIPPDRAMELGKALTELPGPVYFHCHQGKHRGPAAAAVACVVAGKLDSDQAIQAMKVMGTGEQYMGLWSSARTAKSAGSEVLARLTVAYRDVAPIPPLAEAMVALDEAFENLVLAGKAGWKKPPDHPDIHPPHEALRAREIFAEIMRTDEFKARSVDFKARMQAGERASDELESLLRAGKGDPRLIEKAFDSLRRSCFDCHKPYRNTPKK